MANINLTIKGFPLIKFQSAERIESLRQGHLYAKTLVYYRKLEEETGDADIGDGFEAMLHVNNGKLINKSTGEVHELNDTLLRTMRSDDFVFCMFGIYPETKVFEFSAEQREKLLSFGDTALLILDSEEFINRVKQAAAKNGLEVHLGAVQYYNPSEDIANIWISLFEGMWKVSLWKRESYRYQQEVRFVFLSEDASKDHVELDIGDISHISEVISSASILESLTSEVRQEDQIDKH